MQFGLRDNLSVPLPFFFFFFTPASQTAAAGNKTHSKQACTVACMSWAQSVLLVVLKGKGRAGI